MHSCIFIMHAVVCSGTGKAETSNRLGHGMGKTWDHDFVSRHPFRRGLGR